MPVGSGDYLDQSVFLGFSPLVDVAGPGVACCVGVEECDLVTVAEGIGDQRRR